MYCFLLLLITLSSYLQPKELKSFISGKRLILYQNTYKLVFQEKTLPLEGMLQTGVYEKWKPTKNNFKAKHLCHRGQTMAGSCFLCL